jgi:predicted N-acetyltransferase YhbS
MSLEIRSYNHVEDYERVGDFLIDRYQPGENHLNWLQSRWEYMHYHSLILKMDRTKIGVVEAGGRIVGVVHFEHNQGQIYFQVHPAYDHVKGVMLDYAVANFGGMADKNGGPFLAIYVNEADITLRRLARSQGFNELDTAHEVMSRFMLDKPLPDITVPDGFSLKSLADENDLHKINRVLWRGFNHEGPPPAEEIPGRRFAQEAPNYRKELTMVAVAPDGNFVSFCGIWYMLENRVTYVEPVATDPDYRRMGLGTAVVLEGIRRTIPLGSEVAWVGSDQPFYLAMGFEKMFTVGLWVKTS